MHKSGRKIEATTGFLVEIKPGGNAHVMQNVLASAFWDAPNQQTDGGIFWAPITKSASKLGTSDKILGTKSMRFFAQIHPSAEDLGFYSTNMLPYTCVILHALALHKRTST